MSAHGVSAPYLLGFSAEETRRLDFQAELVGPTTRRLFQEAGIEPGMRVLDIGCGSGAVTMLAADVVGPTGSVTSVEANPATLAVARSRAAGLSNITFVEGDIDDPALDAALGGDYDAVVGRFILFFLADPVAVLRRLAALLRPGGVIAFHEPAHQDPTAEPRCADLDQMWSWITETYRHAGLDRFVGLRLYSLFRQAGLPGPRLHLDALAGGGPDWPGYELMASLIHILMPRIREYGIATEEEMEAHSLADRLRDHTVATNGVMTTWTYLTGWTRLPG